MFHVFESRQIHNLLLPWSAIYYSGLFQSYLKILAQYFQAFGRFCADLAEQQLGLLLPSIALMFGQ